MWVERWRELGYRRGSEDRTEVKKARGDVVVVRDEGRAECEWVGSRSSSGNRGYSRTGKTGIRYDKIRPVVGPDLFFCCFLCIFDHVLVYCCFWSLGSTSSKLLLLCSLQECP